MFNKPQEVVLDFYSPTMAKRRSFEDNFSGHVRLSDIEYKFYSFLKKGGPQKVHISLYESLVVHNIEPNELYLRVKADKVAVDDVSYFLFVETDPHQEIEIIFTVDDLDELQDTDIVQMGKEYILKIQFPG